jgi:phosphatidate cytidylyltransferase
VKMNNLTVRLLFAAGAIPLFLWSLWAGGWPRWSLLGFVLVTAAWEASRLVRFKYPQSSRITEYLLPAGVLLCALIGEGGPWSMAGKWLPFVYVAMLLALISTGFRERSREDAFVWIALQGFVFGFFALAARAIFALASWGVPAGTHGWSAAAPLLWVAMACWAGDTGAYAAGKLFGKRKLCPELSPAKTVEGAIGALVWAVGLSLYWAPRYFTWSIPVVVAIGIALAVCGILGDLLESAAKRWSGVKDSSQIFPGHGGAFDRFDSLLLAAPVLWVIFVALG